MTFWLRALTISSVGTGITISLFLFGKLIFGPAFFWAVILGPGVLLGLQLQFLLTRRKLICFLVSAILLPAMLLFASGLQKFGMPESVILTAVFEVSLYILIRSCVGKLAHSPKLIAVYVLAILAAVIVHSLPHFKMELAFLAPVIAWQILAILGVSLANSPNSLS